MTISHTLFAGVENLQVKAVAMGVETMTLWKEFGSLEDHQDRVLAGEI